jgi:uncharacterized protein YkwD
MGRVSSTAVAAVIWALGVAGCGGATESAAVPAAAEPVAAEVAAVEPTDGRLGAATLQRSGAPLRRLSPGGRPDLRPRRDAPRRDGVGAGAACPDLDAAPRAETLPVSRDATLCLLNGERADRGLAPLAPNGRLAAAATAYAHDLVAGTYFSHTGRDGSGVAERIERSGYLPRDAGWVLGENLAWGTGGLATPAAIMQAWMNSPGHRENILNPSFREIGVGVVAGNPAAADGLGATYATEFGAIEEAERAEPVAPRARKARKRARRARKARQARSASRGGQRARRVKARLAR